MNLLDALPGFQAYAASTTILGLNLLGLANATAISRTKAGEVVNPEDKKLNAEAEVVFEGGNDVTSRYRRAHRNALENTPLFIVTSLVLTLMGVAANLAWGIFMAYAVLRIVHSVCYVKGIQPVRTAAFGLAMLVQAGVLVLIAYGAFT